MQKETIKVFLFDFSRVLIFPKDDTYSGLLNANKLPHIIFIKKMALRK